MTEIAIQQQPGKTVSTGTTTILDRVKSPETIFSITTVLPANINVNKWIAMASLAIASNSNLNGCSFYSIKKLLILAAKDGLMLGTPEASIVRYGQDATLVIGYQGMLKIMSLAGVKNVKCRVVYENEEFTYTEGTDTVVKHCPRFKDRGDMVAVYAIATMSDGAQHIDVMSKADVDKVRTNNPAWKNHYDEMARKTVLKRLFKYMTKENASAAIEEEERAEYADTRVADTQTQTIAVPEAYDADTINDDEREQLIAGVNKIQEQSYAVN